MKRTLFIEFVFWMPTISLRALVAANGVLGDTVSPREEFLLIFTPKLPPFYRWKGCPDSLISASNADGLDQKIRQSGRFPSTIPGDDEQSWLSYLAQGNICKQLVTIDSDGQTKPLILCMFTIFTFVGTAVKINTTGSWRIVPGKDRSPDHWRFLCNLCKKMTFLSRLRITNEETIVMSLLKRIWTDESGLVLSAEAVVIGTLGVVGATVGLSMASTAINKELEDFAHAVRSLDQSYSVTGFGSPRAWTAGSHFRQQDVETSLKELGDLKTHEIPKRDAKKSKKKRIDKPNQKQPEKKRRSEKVQETSA